MLVHIHITKVFLHLGLLYTSSWADDRVIFGDSDDGSRTSSGGCTTVGGPGAGSQCQIPFVYKGISRDGCITEADPDGKAWCSTRLDSDGVHVANGKHWAHCSQQCPMANIQQSISSSSFSSSSSSGSSSSSAFTVKQE